jgi:hypothetical protein
MRAVAIAVVLASGCWSATGDEVRGYGYGAAPVECFDEACRIVEAHLADLRAEEITYYQAVNRIMALGERAVPTLLRELAAESVLHVRVSAYVLTALGHVDEVTAWCRGLGRDRDGRDLACTPD